MIPDPTRVFDLNVAIPATSNIPVLTLSVEAIPVSEEPSPEKVVAVTTPVKNPSPSALIVTPDPAMIFPANVETPDTFTSSSSV